MLNTAILLAYQLCWTSGWYDNGIRYYPKEYPRCNEIVATVEQAFKKANDPLYDLERQQDMKTYLDGVEALTKEK